MRIALIGPTYPFKGGIAHHTTLLAKALRDLGHEVLFISYTRQYPKILYGRSDKDPSAAPLKTEVHYLIDSINPLTWFKTAREILKFEPEQLILPWWVPFWAPLYLFLTRWLALRRAPISITYLCHNVLPHESSRLKRWLTTITLTQGDHFLAQSESERQRLLELIPEADTVMVPLPTYRQLLEAQDQDKPIADPFEGKRFKALFCGIIRRYKGLDILLEAVSLLKTNRLINAQFRLVVAGEFWKDPADFRQFIRKEGIEHLVVLENRYLTNAELAAYLHAADVVILPYRSASQSAIVQTALAADTPIIGSDVGGISEEIQHGINGLLVPPEDPAALAKSILYFFENGIQRDKAAKASYEATHSWAHFAAELVKLADGHEAVA